MVKKIYYNCKKTAFKNSNLIIAGDFNIIRKIDVYDFKDTAILG